MTVLCICNSSGLITLDTVVMEIITRLYLHVLNTDRKRLIV